MAHRARFVAVVLLTIAACALLWRFTRSEVRSPDVVDRDRDGLDDRLERALAVARLPAIHQFAPDQDGCLAPTPRPVLFRARPRITAGQIDLNDVAITYVLLYAADCGPLGHDGDHEAFTVLVRRAAGSDEWHTTAALAVAHQGTPAERVSVGTGAAIWVSRSKHSNYASLAACVPDDFVNDECQPEGPVPDSLVFLNVGEPRAPLADDVGDVMIAAGADPKDQGRVASCAMGAIGGTPETGDESAHRLVESLVQRPFGPVPIQCAYILFRGHRIWNHDAFLGAGDITAQLSLTRKWTTQAGVDWEDTP